MHYTSFVFCLLACATLVCANRDDLWREWKRVHGKTYNDASESVRRAQWERSVDEIQEHNLRHDLGLETYTMGLNQFSDLSWEEFEQMYLNKMPNTTVGSDSQQDSFVPDANVWLPDSFDWRTMGIIPPVKDQGLCQSCWAFSAVGALESQYKMRFKEKVLFSEQQLIDCTFGYGNHGCHGGSMDTAYEYLKSYGLETADDYPYSTHEDKCQYNKTKGIIKVRTSFKVHSGNERTLQMLVYKYGPASVAINADQGFKSYKSGIYTSKTCHPCRVNHGLLTVGYANEAGSDYWIIKNSWGSTWGEQGYVRFGRNRGNMCGIASFASTPLINKVEA